MCTSAPGSVRTRPPSNRIAMCSNRTQDILENDTITGEEKLPNPSGRGLISAMERDVEFFASPIGDIANDTALEENPQPSPSEYIPSYAYKNTMEMTAPYSYDMQSDNDDPDDLDDDL